MRSEWISKTVDIAPGHRILIAEFITKVQNIVQPKKLKTLVNKRKQNYFPSVPAKKQKYPSPSAESNHLNIAESRENSTTDLDLADVASKIRMQIAKWQRLQTINSLMQLKDHEHFEVRISTSEKPGIPADAYIIGNMCNKRLPLSMGSKCGSFSISNWSAM